jgi:hypothetical protein
MNKVDVTKHSSHDQNTVKLDNLKIETIIMRIEASGLGLFEFIKHSYSSNKFKTKFKVENCTA